MPTVRGHSPFAVTKPPAGCQIDWGHPLARGLLGSWDGLDGGGRSAFNSVDRGFGSLGTSVVYNNTGGWTFNASTSAAINVAGSSGSDSTAIRSVWDLGTKPFSIETIFKTTVNGYGDIFRYDNDVTGGLFLLRIDNAGKINFLIADAARATSEVTSALTYKDGVFYHVVADRSNGLLSLYVNGALVATASDGSRNIVAGAETPYLAIGAAIHGPPDGTWLETFNGTILYVRIRGKPTSSVEAQQMYQEPFAVLRASDYYRRYQTIVQWMPPGIGPLLGDFIHSQSPDATMMR